MIERFFAGVATGLARIGPDARGDGRRASDVAQYVRGNFSATIGSRRAWALRRGAQRDGAGCRTVLPPKRPLLPRLTGIAEVTWAPPTPTFCICVTASAAVANLPGVNRVFVTFTDSGGTFRGETSAAVPTQ